MAQKQDIKKIFENTYLPLEIIAKEKYDYFLRESTDEKSNKIIAQIRNDEVKHIELCKRAIEILK